MKNLIDQLYLEHILSKDDILFLLNNLTKIEDVDYLHKKARDASQIYYDDNVYMRGLIEFTNYCKNDCLYCGIRHSNKFASRYRLSELEILECCEEGSRLGYKTFVLQGGEDPYYNDDRILSMIKLIKESYPDNAITLSFGEKSYESYKKYYDAGVDRYLLRHETYSKSLYENLHPNMSFENRIECLKNLKTIGYQVGAGFMVGLPGQTNEDFVEDLFFLKELSPHMVGIGPFIPQKDTPLANKEKGTLEKTCILLSIIRLMLPKVLLPATTALGSINPKGRELGLKSGANVVMPNLSPVNVRDKYALYDGKICTGDEAAHCRQCIEKRIESAGFKVDMSRGDHFDRR
ncbi:iron-only hydrogenase maturation protein HydE [Natranaerovirga pectinivora]|uniref:Iron-only hydrogenase maturation protein HydE n=1 Tax=Natranaerovirga pectinivora TaxID=682400 RepID=A0A4R3MMV5_9FIRM|nr:[FeFe] hydrogenase H-cluster radical SAM maturase HydE [Natranaerovirga pectinivora]TCT16313.1 iron-only hydrogenase maturation protein HydE [Natranaerovirga pectinivora]